MKGRIIRGVGGFYYVKSPESELVYECRPRGIFRKDMKKPLVGDMVLIEEVTDDHPAGNIVEIEERRSELVRPAVANVDQVFLILAVADPDPSAFLLDRFLLRMGVAGLPVIVAMNKTDLDGEGISREFEHIYRGTGISFLFFSAKRGDGIEAFRERLSGKISVLAGPSGVGKSTLINTLLGYDLRRTGEVSEKLKRGKQTTTSTELLEIGENTFLMDTPGFSSLELPDIGKEELGSYFPEIRERAGQCFFAGCAHISEPDCAVRLAVENGMFEKLRYASYTAFYEELKGGRRKGRASSKGAG
ncbi:MAG: ribosome small subunit-dependent GTPase A [Lachnospiraceae bacterium]|nr:ribosome small subunit-dependent GTPase A [Lachnospiraceae bacterium]